MSEFYLPKELLLLIYSFIGDSETFYRFLGCDRDIMMAGILFIKKTTNPFHVYQKIELRMHNVITEKNSLLDLIEEFSKIFQKFAKGHLIWKLKCDYCRKKSINVSFFSNGIKSCVSCKPKLFIGISKATSIVGKAVLDELDYAEGHLNGSTSKMFSRNEIEYIQNNIMVDDVKIKKKDIEKKITPKLKEIQNSNIIARDKRTKVVELEKIEMENTKKRKREIRKIESQKKKKKEKSIDLTEE